MNWRRNRTHKTRSGVATVEGAVVLSAWLLIVFATFDLTLAAFRYDALSEVARMVARRGIVRGATAAPDATPWGPETYTATADADDEVGQLVQTLLPTMDAESVEIEIEWIDGGNQEDQRIAVQVEYLHQPLSPFTAFSGGLLLSGSSTMRIAN